MTFWGELEEGGQMLLGAPQEAVLSFDREAPADQLKAVFSADGLWEPLREVRVYQEGLGVFRGIVDEQNTRLGPGGLTIELVCRSREALLLDNEAEPGCIRSPSLEALERRLLEPLGLGPIQGPRDRVRGELTVEKGSSCWAVLARFCREYLGTEPYVDFDGSLHCGFQKERRLTLPQVISGEICRLPCKRLGSVWKQGYRGGYDTLFRAGEGQTLPRRYVSAQSGQDPRILLEEARRESFSLRVTCPGLWWPVRNAVADVTVPLAGKFLGCPVKRAMCRQDQAGERTSFVLEQGEG